MMVAQLTQKGHPLATVQNDLTPAQMLFLEVALNRIADLERQEIEREMSKRSHQEKSNKANNSINPRTSQHLRKMAQARRRKRGDVSWQ